MDKEQALEGFNRNKYFIETLTTKYLSYPNYEDIKVVHFVPYYLSNLYKQFVQN